MASVLEVTMDERRGSHRAIPTTEVTVLIGGNRPARVLNISPGGAQIELASALSPRFECPMSLPLLDGMVRLRARITRCQLTSVAKTGPNHSKIYRAGVEFIGIDPKMASAIASAYPPTEGMETGPAPVRGVELEIVAIDSERSEPN
jgi:hypothetical protein